MGVVSGMSPSLYIYGGQHHFKAFPELWSFSLAQQQWVLLKETFDGDQSHDYSSGQAVAFGVCGVGMVSHGPALYLFGGRTSAGVITNHFRRFDLKNRNWQLLKFKGSHHQNCHHVMIVCKPSMTYFNFRRSTSSCYGPCHVCRRIQRQFLHIWRCGGKSVWNWRGVQYFTPTWPPNSTLYYCPMSQVKIMLACEQGNVFLSG